MSCERALNFDQWKTFSNPKTNPNLDPNPNPNQGAIFLGGAILRVPEYDYGLFKNLRRIISKEVSYLSWQNMYLNLKTTCHIKLNFLLWTKLLDNILLTNYLISVAATLIL